MEEGAATTTNDNITYYTTVSDAEAERIAVVIEEMAESQKEACKILRHGFESRSPFKPDGPTNRQKLETELGNVIAGICLMVSAGDVDPTAIRAAAEEKFNDYGCWLHHQPDTVLKSLQKLL